MKKLLFVFLLGIAFAFTSCDKSDDSVKLIGEDEISFNKNLTAKIGANLSYPTLIKRLYFDLRLSLSYEISPSVSVNSAWGIYRQFMSRSIIWDDEGNRRDFLVGADNKTIPVLNSQHLVFGTSYH